MSIQQDQIEQITDGLKTAFINKSIDSNVAYKPQFLFNDIDSGHKVLTSIEDELKNCEEFIISVAFITHSGIEPLLLTLQELERRNIPGRILTTDYLTFSDPKALNILDKLTNIEIKMYCTKEKEEGFHTKGYIFKEQDLYRIIIGSSNMTLRALTVNKEWNTKLVSTTSGEYVEDIVSEFNTLWEEAVPIKSIIHTYTKMYEEKKKILKNTKIPTLTQYKLEPNSMQIAFINSLKTIVKENKDKALLISATGTGKTYASAFALRNMNPKRALFLVHREQIADQAKKSYKDVFGDTKSFGLLSGNEKKYHSDYLFSTIQMMSREEVMKMFAPDDFQIIVIDEVHRAGSASYDKIIEYFKPDFWLGMTASPERMDGFDIYKLFDHNIAYEITLQKALEENLLCPFQYFGITDLMIDGKIFNDESDLKNFNQLVCEQRVDYILKQAEYFGYSGERVKGLIFCRSKLEGKALSEAFNKKKTDGRLYKTTFLSGDDSQKKRKSAIERLVKEDIDSTDYLDYIFTVDIFNEGVDIPEVNQVIMLRPTKSPIIFIQQLGRGLRKSEGKEFVVILDFIGNYANNFMIPIALSGDRTYNKDNMRRYVIEGNRIIPGSSSIHFDEIAKERIFTSIDKAKPDSVKFIKEEYKKLKNKVGHIPTYLDFENYGAIDMMLVFENTSLGSYHEFLKKHEAEYQVKFTVIQEELLRFVSAKIANGKRLVELTFLQRLVRYYTGICGSEELKEWYEKHKTSNAIKVLANEFVTNQVNKRKYENSIFIHVEDEKLSIAKHIETQMYDPEFLHAFEELLNYGFRRNQMFYDKHYKNTDFVLYQKYTYEDVCKLLNWSQNVVAQNIGGYKYDEETNTFPVFINYHKSDEISDTIRYEDRFLDTSTIIALSKQPRKIDSKDVQLIYNAKETGMKIYLFVRKNKDDNISHEFYFLGEVTAAGEPKPILIKNTNKNAVEITYRLETPVREDIYEYIISE